MNRAMTALGGAIGTCCSIGPALAQDQGFDPAQTNRTPVVRLAPTNAISPSSGTSTVSPSSVPQAMDRLYSGRPRADFSLGGSYAAGRFGTDATTSIWSSALAARLHLGDLTLSASLPWMRLRSRSTVFTTIDSTPVLVARNTSAVQRTNSGFGDLTLGASYTIAPPSSPVELQVSGRAKIATATERSGLSSGKNDYAVGGDVSVPLERFTPFVSLTYRFLGDTSVYRLRDGPAASAGASYKLASNTFLVGSYHYARAATRLVPDAHELFAGVSTRLPASPLRLTGFATAGLSQGAPGASAGLALSVGFGNRDGR